MNKKLLTIFFTISFFTLLMPTAYPENIDPANDGSQYAWAENIGWLNLEPGGDGGYGVDVTSTGLTGFIWGENIGWINLSPSYGGVANDGNGNLSGYAWGENVGWINFDPSAGGVRINACGEFDGYAWGENIGWINFTHSQGRVKTEWVSPLDDVAPETTIDFALQTWFANDVVINLLATDCGHGVQEIRYSLDALPELILPGAEGTVIISSEGQHTLSYYAVDNDGNTESGNTTGQFGIDKTGPNIMITVPADGATYYMGMTVIADYVATDWLSGVDTVSGTVPAGSPIDTSTTGGKTFIVTAMDTAGNQRTVNHTYTVAIDGIAPTITVTSPAADAIYAVGESVVVDYTVTDSESGVAAVSSTLPNGSLIDTSEEGTFTFNISAVDNVGNTNYAAIMYTVAATVQHQLTTSVNPPGNGSISPDCSVGCMYDEGTDVVLNALEDSGYPFTGWTGCDAPSGSICTMTMSGDKSLTAEFDSCEFPVKREGSGTAYSYFLQDTYIGASDLDIIYTQDTVLIENIDFYLPILVTLESGYNCDYSGITGTTVINGNMTVSDGTIIIQDGIIEVQ